MSKSIEELSLILSNSLCIEHCVGDWNNVVKASNSNSELDQHYTILLLIDYQHLYYHIGFAIDKYNVSMVPQIDQIRTKINRIVETSYKNGLSSIHYTGKIFGVCNCIEIDGLLEIEKFNTSGLSLSIYTIDDERLAIKVPVVYFTPANLFTLGKQQKDIEIIYTSHDYTIWSEKDGTVGFAVQMSVINGVTKNIEKQKMLGEITPLRNELKMYTHSKRQKKKSADILATAIKDTFEDNLDIAKESIRNAIIQFKKESSLIKSIDALAIYSVFLISLSLIITFTEIWFTFSLIQILFWALAGSSLSTFVPFIFIPNIAHYSKFEFLVEIIIRIVLGLFSGIILFLGIKANIFLGMLNQTDDSFLVSLLAIAVGYSQKFLPNILNKIVDKKLDIA